METLTDRAIGRATLARQLLLERSGLGVPAAVEHLAGLQAQTVHSWYVGLWSRLRDLDADATGALLTGRTLVRVVAMRGTIHLLTARDARWLRPLTQVVHDRMVRGAFGRKVAGLDRTAVEAATRELLAGGPLPLAELRRGLAARFPGADPGPLAETARAWVPVVQAPPRGVWGRSGGVLHATLDDWAGPPVAAPVDDLVRRYLAAFGPASVRDIQQWCGLTRLAEVVDRLRPGLVTFRDPRGVELVDLPGAPRPGPDVPAPVRFLYDFDNLLLSHADRRRVVGDADYAAQGFDGTTNEQPSSVLVDGAVAATWRILRDGPAATLRVRPFRRLTAAERAAVQDEGAALLAFATPDARPDVLINP
ncbi:winged helix DNA-binding domain-containing protein [Spirilliplanes yamanashiensis]|uniref:Winged helix DNA-binding domain-containing protein n=1 Tax=Spirilliplanes yamanashiensis TaxID=42233 RepID=A0A8J3YAZ3_9ACTN|nr:winged helix DNA-binding domain-containing protein [Spirilliplanes yamanashiensis]MDP9818892.1 hypothetical protein [Spirilliplanes yamanashiensis]GIJ05346.1 hypothetical protein Sya03_46980 [Spirilliplanes yamanashiensis]